MNRIRRSPLPADALLQRYAQTGAYTDCFALDVPGPVTHAAYVEAFYTTWVFKLERWLLARFVSRPSTDAEAEQLAAGQRGDFSAWTIEARVVDQLLMCDWYARTRSWLMVAPTDAGNAAHATRLYFGSAVVPQRDPRGGEPRMGAVFRALLGFHVLYSRVLLSAAALSLQRNARRP
jgi:hypothetical protein